MNINNILYNRSDESIYCKQMILSANRYCTTRGEEAQLYLAETAQEAQPSGTIFRFEVQVQHHHHALRQTSI